MSEETISQGATGVHGHAHHRYFVSRREAIKIGGASAVGVAAWSMFGPGIASANPGGDPAHGNRGLPSPVGGYSPILESIFGLQIPFFLPIEIDPFTGFPAGGPFDPSTISDFNGFVAVTEADGVTNNTSEGAGTPRRWAVDARLIEGVYKDRDGRTRVGAFTFL